MAGRSGTECGTKESPALLSSAQGCGTGVLLSHRSLGLETGRCFISVAEEGCLTAVLSSTEDACCGLGSAPSPRSGSAAFRARSVYHWDAKIRTSVVVRVTWQQTIANASSSSGSVAQEGLSLSMRGESP